MNHNQLNKIFDECITRGICSISPDLSYLQELIKEYTRELAFYLLRLKEIGITNDNIKNNLIDAVSSLSLNVAYTEEQFSSLIKILSTDLNQTKELYTSVYSQKNMDLEILKSNIKPSKSLSIPEAKRQGQKIAKFHNKKITLEQKTWLEIIYNVLKSICVHLAELKDLDIEPPQTYEILLLLLNSRAQGTVTIRYLQELVEKAVDFDHSLLIKLQETREEKYGKVKPTEISTSTKANKAILVAGTNLKEMEMLLEATKNKNIDIYTHGHMLMAHAFPAFKKYPHLVGHIGKGIETYLLDFASFPGAIFLTKHSFYKVDRLYRSRIFTTDIAAPKGVIIIKNNNFEPLIESALDAKGFINSIIRPSIKLTLDEDVIINKIQKITEKIKSGKIKNLFFMGVSNHTKVQKNYFDKFLNLLGDDCFVLSFSYTNDKNNVLLVESDYGFPLVYRTLEAMTKEIPIEILNPIVLNTRCEIHTISNVIYLKKIGIKNIYFADCPPVMVNPHLIETLREIYSLKEYTTPENDIEEILSQD